MGYAVEPDCVLINVDMALGEPGALLNGERYDAAACSASPPLPWARQHSRRARLWPSASEEGRGEGSRLPSLALLV
jgi:hypothetical protein